MKKELIRDGRTQPVFSYGESILEKVYVETPVDTDQDGKLDLVAVYIRRPRETAEGLRVPAIYVANPYMMHCNEDWYVPHDVNQELAVFPDQNICPEGMTDEEWRLPEVTPQFPRETRGFAEESPAEEPDFEAISDTYSYFVCRGYASVFCGGLGTKDSEGLTLTGSRQELAAFRAVIDWLCGRARAFTNKTDNIEIKAHWCTGQVAMTGKSYLGTMCIGVAATGVEGLRTIIPEAAISNWYDYYRSNGLVVPALEWQGDDLDILAKYCFSRALDPEDYPGVADLFEKRHQELLAGQDRLSGNYNLFWEERNYLNRISQMKASALIIHGINDWNVKTNQCVPLFRGLRERGIPAKLLLHQGDHIYIYNMEDSPALELVHRWLDYHLYGLENGVVEDTAEVLVQSNLNPALWQESETIPPRDAQRLRFPIVGCGERVFTDDLAAAGYDRQKDNQREWLDSLVLSEQQDKVCCLKYLWDPFGPGQQGEGADFLRISGEVVVSFSAAIDKETAILSVMLVEYGSEHRLTVRQEPVSGEKFSWGPEAPQYDKVRFLWEEEPSQYRVISRGHMNAQNRESLWSKSAVTPESFYEYRLSMVPTDYTVSKGKKLGLLFYGADAMQTLRPDSAVAVSIKEESIVAEFPAILLPCKK